MGADFPVPRGELPRVHVTAQEHAARKLQMERILLQTLDEYDHFREVDQGRVDPQQWKLVGSRDQLQLFQERHLGSASMTSTSTTPNGASSDGDSDVVDFNFTPAPPSNNNDGSSALSATHKRKLKSLRMVGDLQGHVENAVFSAVTKSHEEMALVYVFLHDDVADGALLHTMESPTPDKPLHFLGYKWFVKKAKGGGRLVKHRDSVYVESCGLTTTRAGEAIGYLLIESVDLAGFPEMPERNCVRSLQSVRVLFRQKSANVVELFMTGVVEPAGNIPRAFTTLMTTDTVLSVSRCMELAETKRLTKMIVAQQGAREQILYGQRRKIKACSLCHQATKFFNTVSLVGCQICGHTICTRCRTSKRVFQCDGPFALGTFHKVGVCKTCVLQANRNPQASPPPLKVSITATQQQQVHHENPLRSVRSGSLQRPRSSSGSDQPAPAGTNLGHHSHQPPSPPLAFTVPGRHGHQPLVAAGGGVTLFADTDPGARYLVPDTAVESSGRKYPASSLPQSKERRRSGTTPSQRMEYTPAKVKTTVAPSFPAPASFATSAPGGTYDLRSASYNTTASGTPVSTRAPSLSSASPNTSSSSSNSNSSRGGASSRRSPDLFAQMMELRRLAESTSAISRQNDVYMHQAAQPPMHQQTQQQRQAHRATQKLWS